MVFDGFRFGQRAPIWKYTGGFVSACRAVRAASSPAATAAPCRRTRLTAPCSAGLRSEHSGFTGNTAAMKNRTCDAEIISVRARLTRYGMR